MSRRRIIHYATTMAHTKCLGPFPTNVSRINRSFASPCSVWTWTRSDVTRCFRVTRYQTDATAVGAYDFRDDTLMVTDGGSRDRTCKTVCCLIRVVTRDRRITTVYEKKSIIDWPAFGHFYFHSYEILRDVQQKRLKRSQATSFRVYRVRAREDRPATVFVRSAVVGGGFRVVCRKRFWRLRDDTDKNDIDDW